MVAFCCGYVNRQGGAQTNGGLKSNERGRIVRGVALGAQALQIGADASRASPLFLNAVLAAV